MSISNLDHTIAPDIFTASAEYDTRFSGTIGSYFLSVQRQAVLSHLKRISTGPVSILEIGGGHLQITRDLIALGHSVTVHGSSEEALNKLDSSDLAPKVGRVVCPIEQLNHVAKRSDVIIALRLLPHVLDERAWLGQMIRLAKIGIIYDFSTNQGLNSLSKFTFQLKKRIEKNTRPYINHSPTLMKKILADFHCTDVSFTGQFVFPMGLHRAVNNLPISKLAESIFSPVRDLFGNPVICGAKVSG